MLTDIGDTGTPAPVDLVLDNKPVISSSQPRIDWHPLLNTYVITWVGRNAGNTTTFINYELWDSRRDPTVDGRPGLRATAIANLAAISRPIADTFSKLAVKWLWGSTVSGQERRFAMSWINDDGTTAAGGNHLDVNIIDLSESSPGDGYDTPTNLGTAPTETLVRTAPEVLDSCDLAYNGSSNLFYLIFARTTILPTAEEAIHMAVFKASATSAVDLTTVSAGSGINVTPVITSVGVKTAFPTVEAPDDFRNVRAAYGHNEIKIVFYSGSGPTLVHHVSITPGYNMTTVGADPAAWPTATIPYFGPAGSSWAAFGDIDTLVGPSFPSQHGGRRGGAAEDFSVDGKAWVVSGEPVLSANAPLSIIFDGDDYIVAALGSGNDAIVAVLSGETGEILQSTVGTLLGSSLDENLALAATPYGFFGFVGMRPSDLSIEVGGSLRYRSGLKDLRLVGTGADTFDSGAREPFLADFFKIRDGARSGNVAPDGFIRLITGVDEDTSGGPGDHRLIGPADSFGSPDIGQRVVIDPGTGSSNGDPAVYRIVSIVSATTVVVSPDFPAAASVNQDIYVGWYFDRNFGGIRLASNGYVTCMAAVTSYEKLLEADPNLTGGGLHFMVVRNDANLDDFNDADAGGICLRQEGVIKADVIWTGAMFQIYYLVGLDVGAGQKEFFVRRVDVSPRGEVIPDQFSGSEATTVTWGRSVSRKLSDPTGTVTDKMDVTDFKVCYNGKNVAIGVWGTDLTNWTGAVDQNRSFMDFMCVPPHFIGAQEPDLTIRHVNAEAGTETNAVWLVNCSGCAGTTSTGTVTGGAATGVVEEVIVAAGGDRTYVITMSSGRFDVGDLLTFTGAGTGTVDSVVVRGTILTSTIPIFRNEHIGTELEISAHAGPASNDRTYKIRAVNSSMRVELEPGLPDGAGVPETCNINVRQMDHDLTLPQWRSLDMGGGIAPGGDSQFMFGGDLIWNGQEFVAIAHVGRTSSASNLIWSAFKDTDLRLTRDIREEPSKDAGVSDRSLSGGLPLSPVHFIDTGGEPFRLTNLTASPLFFVADPTGGSGVQLDFSWGKYRCSIAYNPIDRVYAIAYTGQYKSGVGGTDPDQDWPQVMVEYFEENGVPLAYNSRMSTAFRDERQFLIFGGKEGQAAGTGWAADSPVLIWTGKNFALNVRGYNIDTAASPEEQEALSRQHLMILHPKEPGVIHSVAFAGTGTGLDGSLHLSNQDMIYDPVSGDFLMTGVAMRAFDETFAGDPWDRNSAHPGRLHRLSPIHLAQVAGAFDVDIDNVIFQKTPFAVRWDQGTQSDGTPSRLHPKPRAPGPGADPMGMKRSMMRYRLKNLDQIGTLVDARTLDGWGLDDPSGHNINMNGK